MELIFTAPTVVYKVELKDGTKTEIENPSKLLILQVSNP